MTDVAVKWRIDGAGMVSPDAAYMDPPYYQVIVIRAWREQEGLRIRLLSNGRPPRQWAVASIADAFDVLSTLLGELLAAPGQHAMPPETSD